MPGTTSCVWTDTRQIVKSSSTCSSSGKRWESCHGLNRTMVGALSFGCHTQTPFMIGWRGAWIRYVKYMGNVTLELRQHTDVIIPPILFGSCKLGMLGLRSGVDGDHLVARHESWLSTSCGEVGNCCESPPTFVRVPSVSHRTSMHLFGLKICNNSWY